MTRCNSLAYLAKALSAPKTVKQECQEVAVQQAFSKGDPEHLVLVQTKALSDPLDVPLVPKQDRAGLLRFLRFLGLICNE